MEVRHFKATWGMSGSLGEQLDRIKEAGFDGSEATLPEDVASFRGESAARGLHYAALAFPLSVAEAEQALDAAVDSGACLLNLHSGKDWWPFEQGVAYFEGVEKLREASPIPICHETHRGRLLFSPAVTAAYLREVPGIQLAADFSHWTCVCESMLEDQTEAVNLAIEHTIHIHSRVGHEEGPQVSDPRAPEFAGRLATFTGWWQAIVDSARRRNLPWIGIDPEFGPPGYMPTLPYTRQPVADLWEVCVWMRDRLRAELK
jgi:sugar phosphate isomerase/epimerase